MNDGSSRKGPFRMMVDSKHISVWPDPIIGYRLFPDGVCMAGLLGACLGGGPDQISKGDWRRDPRFGIGDGDFVEDGSGN